MTTHSSTKSNRFRTTCSCGWKGKTKHFFTHRLESYFQTR